MTYLTPGQQKAQDKLIELRKEKARIEKLQRANQKELYYIKVKSQIRRYNALKFLRGALRWIFRLPKEEEFKPMDRVSLKPYYPGCLVMQVEEVQSDTLGLSMGNPEAKTFLLKDVLQKLPKEIQLSK